MAQIFNGHAEVVSGKRVVVNVNVAVFSNADSFIHKLGKGALGNLNNGTAKIESIAIAVSGVVVKRATFYQSLTEIEVNLIGIVPVKLAINEVDLSILDVEAIVSSVIKKVGVVDVCNRYGTNQRLQNSICH